MTTIKFEPFGPRIVVLPDAVEEKKGEIHLPGTAKKETVKGMVVAFDRLSPPWERVFAGMRVRFMAHCGSEEVIDGVKHLILHESEVLGSYPS
jgi:co-chaperonin GroES (HSP10)